MPILLKSFESGGDADQPIGDLGGDEYDWAQSFTLDATADVGSLALYLKKVNSISSAITVRIETNSASAPSGTLAHANATTTVTPSNTSYEWLDALFSNSFSLTGSTKYWIVLSVANQANNDHYDWYSDTGNGYASHGASGSVNGGAFSSESASTDLYFRIYAPENIGGSPMFFRGGITVG